MKAASPHRRRQKILAALCVLSAASLGTAGPLVLAPSGHPLLIGGTLLLAFALFRESRHASTRSSGVAEALPLPLPLPPPLDRLDVLALLVLTGAALFLRTWQLDTFPLHVNLDEEINVDLASRILQGEWIPPVLSEYVHGEPSTVYYLMALSSALFGESVWSMRLPAALAGTLAVPLVYLLARRLAGGAPSFLAGLLLTVDPWHLTFSREANSIVFAPTAALLTAVLFLRARTTGRTRDYLWAGLALGSGFHTYPAFLVVPAAILATTLTVHACRRTLPDMCVTAIFTAGAALAASPVILTSLVSTEFWGRPASMLVSINGLLEGAVRIGQNTVSILELYLGVMTVAHRVTCIQGMGLVLGCIGMLALWRKQTDPSLRWGMLFVALAALAPVLFLDVDVSSPRRSQFVRPALFVLAALACRTLGEALGGGRRRARTTSWLLMAILGLSLGSYSTAYDEIARTRDFWPSEIQALRSAERLSEPVLSTRALVERPFFSSRPGRAPGLSFLARAAGVRTVPGLAYGPGLGSRPRARILVSTARESSRLRALAPGVSLEAVSPKPGLRSWLYGTLTEQDVEPYRGLMFSVGGASGESVTAPRPVKGVTLPPVADVVTPSSGAALTRRWKGALYIPERGWWTLRARASGVRHLDVDRLIARRDSRRARTLTLSGWMEEGYHPFELEQEEAGQGPPRVVWSRRGSVSPWERDRRQRREEASEVPLWAFRRWLPSSSYERARPALQVRPRRVRIGAVRILEELPPMAWVQRIVGARGRLHLLAPGMAGLLWVVRQDLEDEPGWNGLDGPATAAPGLLRTWLDAQSAEGGLAVLEDGTIYVLSSRPPGLHEFDPAGHFRRSLGDMGLILDPRGLALDEASETLFVHDKDKGALLSLSLEGELLDVQRSPRIHDLAIDPSRHELVTVQAPGLIARHDEAGRYRNLWRASHVTMLSRLAVDEEGRVFLLSPESCSLTIYSREGEVLGPPLRLPSRGEDEDWTGPMAYTGVCALPGGRVALSFCLPLNGLVVLRFEESSLEGEDQLPSRLSLRERREYEGEGGGPLR